MAKHPTTRPTSSNSDWLNQPYDTWANPSEGGHRQKCIICGQRHLRKASLIHSAGTRHGSSTGPRYTVAYHSQTDLAAQYAPPECPTPLVDFWFKVHLIAVGLALLAPIGWFVDQTGVGFFDWLGYKLVEAAMAPVLAYLLVRLVGFSWYPAKKAAAKAAQDEWELAYNKWAQAWVCMDCGAMQ